MSLEQEALYVAGEETLPSYQIRVIEQGKFTYSPSWRAFEKQTQLNIKVKKQIKTIKNYQKELVESNADKSYSYCIEKTKFLKKYITIWVQ